MLSKKCLRILILASKPPVKRAYSQEYVPKPLRSLKAKSTRNTVQFFVDSQRVRAVAGNGGDGCISFLSAWCKDHAGPDGGDGGNGGHVIFQATHSVKGLNHCSSVIQAQHGEKGYNKDCNGKNASHVVIPVPLGTIIKDESGKVVGDLSSEGVMFVAARGGAGGRGNHFFLTDTHQAPDVAEIGAAGETNTYTLEVRSMAHIGLLGFPNAGKSTLLRALTRARPKVAPHPFTTVKPHIGMVPYDDYEQVAIADLPGLIPGSHKNHGLGIQFLQHVERCRGLIYLLDGTDDPLNQYETLTYELNQYNEKLSARPYLIVVNKIDLKEARIALEDVKRAVSETDFDFNLDEDKENFDKFVNKDENFDKIVNKDDNFDKFVKEHENFDKLVDKHEHFDKFVSKLENFDNKRESFDNKRENFDENNLKVEESDEKLNLKDKVQVLGISAKTGMNLSQLLRVVREMYDKGEQR